MNDLCDHDVELDWLRLYGFGLPSSSISAVQDLEKLALLTLWGSNLLLAGCNFQALGTEATVCHGSQRLVRSLADQNPWASRRDSSSQRLYEANISPVAAENPLG